MVTKGPPYLTFLKCSNIVTPTMNVLRRVMVRCVGPQFTPAFRVNLVHRTNFLFPYRHLCTTKAPESEPLPVSVPSAAPTGEFTDIPGSKRDVDKYVIMYTCKVCDTRSAKKITKHSYHEGTVIIKCPQCSSYHLIVDRIGAMGEKGWNIEDHIKGEQSQSQSQDNDQDQQGLAENTEQLITVRESGAEAQNQFKLVNNDNVYELTLKDIVGSSGTGSDGDPSKS